MFGLDTTTLIIIGIAIAALILPIIPACVAKSKHSFGWWLYGLLLFPIALIHAIKASEKRDVACFAGDEIVDDVAPVEQESFYYVDSVTGEYVGEYIAPAAAEEDVIINPGVGISPWRYIGLATLWAIPVLGWILWFCSAVFGKNLHKKYYARSYFCSFLLLLIVVIVAGGAVFGLDALGVISIESILEGFGIAL